MSKDDMSPKIIWGMMIGLMLMSAGFIAGEFVYQKEVFTATITEIEYHGQGGIFGSSKATIRFDDGRVYSFYNIPKELREEHTYTLEYRTPYFLKSPSLAIVESLD